MEMIEQPTDRGTVFTLRTRNATVAALMATGSPIAAAMSGLSAAMARNVANLLPERLAEANRREAGPVLAALRGEIEAATARLRAAREAEAVILSVPPSIPTGRFPEIRAIYRTLSPANAAARANAASAEELAALIDGGQALAGLDDQIWNIVKDRAIRLFHIERTGSAARHPLEPTPARLIVSGVDQAAAEHAADMGYQAHRARFEEIEAAESSLQSVLATLAVALDLPPAAILDRALAA